MSLSTSATQIVEAIGAADALIRPDQARRSAPDLILGGPAPDGFSGPVVEFNPQTIDDMLDDVLRVGAALDREPEARRLVVSLRERLDRAAEHVNAYQEGPVVAVLESIQPIRVPGLWTAQLIERAGGRYPLNPTQPKPNAGAGPQHAEHVAAPAVTVHAEMLVATDRLIIATGDLDDCRSTASALSEHKWFADLQAAGNAQIALVNADAFAVPGPGLVDAFEFLVGWLQARESLIPKAFPWEPWVGGGPRDRVEVPIRSTR